MHTLTPATLPLLGRQHQLRQGKIPHESSWQVASQGRTDRASSLLRSSLPRSYLDGFCFKPVHAGPLPVCNKAGSDPGSGESQGRDLRGSHSRESVWTRCPAWIPCRAVTFHCAGLSSGPIAGYHRVLQVASRRMHRTTH